MILTNNFYEFKTLENTAFDEICHTVQSAFTNYYVVVRTTESHLRLQHTAANVDYANSIGVFAKDKLVGFLFMGFDYSAGRIAAYNAGTGIIENHRGKNLTKAMHEEFLKTERAKNLERIYLEVIDKNHAAQKVYGKLGFKATRQLESFNGRTLIKKLKRNNKLEYDIQPFDKAVIEPTWWDKKLTWSNSPNALGRTAAELKSITAVLDGIKVGYSVFNAETGHIHQIAVSPEYRRNYIGSNLLKFTENQIETHLNIINIDSSNNALLGLMNYCGLNKFVSQYEMILDL